jgi:hypothetical protein
MGLRRKSNFRQRSRSDTNVLRQTEREEKRQIPSKGEGREKWEETVELLMDELQVQVERFLFFVEGNVLLRGAPSIAFDQRVMADLDHR